MPLMPQRPLFPPLMPQRPLFPFHVYVVVPPESVKVWRLPLWSYVALFGPSVSWWLAAL